MIPKLIVVSQKHEVDDAYGSRIKKKLKLSLNLSFRHHFWPLIIPLL